jgi:hypothetical protein
VKQSPHFRATGLLTGVNRSTIRSLGIRVGQKCAALHDTIMHVSRIELDQRGTVAKKQRHLKPTDPADFGDRGERKSPAHGGGLASVGEAARRGFRGGCSLAPIEQ